MTIDEAILKAIAYLQQTPVPRGPHVDAAISILEDTQTTPLASARLVAEATKELAEHLDKVITLAATEVKRANEAEARITLLEAQIAVAQETPNA